MTLIRSYIIQFYSLIFLLFCLAIEGKTQDLKINEFMASNSYVVADNFAEMEDWIEIYNPTNEDIDIAGIWVTDDLSNPIKWQIPSGQPIYTTIEPLGHLTLWFDKDTIQGVTHTNSGLKRKGEQIGLYDINLQVIDTITYSEQEKNISFGRFPDGSDNWFFFNEPSPNATNNNSTPYEGFVKGEPIFSIERGFYEGSQILTLSQTFTSGEIKYTVDGSIPNNTSSTYETPITLNGNQIIRASVFQENLIPSKIRTHSYYIDYDLINRNLPVLSLAAENDILWDTITGVFTQTGFVDWENEVNLEILEVDQITNKSVNIAFETNNFAQWENPQKPLNLSAKDEFGPKNIKYRLFPELNVSSFRSFNLGNANMDWGSSMLKDLFAQKIAQKTNLDLQHKRPFSVFFDQEYLGMYFAEAPLNARYFANQVLVDKDSLDVIFQNGGAISGTGQQYFVDFMGFLNSNDLSDNSVFETLESSVDIDNYIDYIITLLYCGNDQWAVQNSWMWKPQHEGKWRWMLKNMDEAFDNPNDQLLSFFTDENGGDNNPNWITLPFRKMLENDDFRSRFISKLADHLYITFHTNNTQTILNNTQELLGNEMVYQIARWGDQSGTLVDPIASLTDWNNNVSSISNFIQSRVGVIHNDAISFFDEIDSLATLDLTVVDEGDGEIFLNSKFVTEAVWNGEYFKNIELKLTAVPAEGFSFVTWNGITVDDPTASTITISLTDDLTTIQAVFGPQTSHTFDVVINEIKYQSDTITETGDWLELYNNSSETINISRWELSDGNDYFILPYNLILEADSYLIIAEDKDQLIQTYNFETKDVIGNLNFKFSNNGEELTLRKSTGELIDFVAYQDSNPWPEIVNQSIELIAPYLDNSQGKNWIESNNSLNSPMASNTANHLHLGNIPNQEINAGDTFEVILLEHYLFSPNTAIQDLTWESTGNENLTVSIDEGIPSVEISYNDWKGIEWVNFTVTDSEGQTSSDSVLFMVGTIINQPSICDENFTTENSPYLIRNPLDIPSGCFLNIGEGTELRFAKNAEITCEGQLLAEGTENNPIEFTSHLSTWGGIFINGADEQAIFDYCSIRNATFGSDSTNQNAAIVGRYSDMRVTNSNFHNNMRSIYAYHGVLLVDNCYFAETNIGEKVNVQFTEAITQNCTLEFTYGDNDAIDYDAVTIGNINNNIILGGEDDGVDVGQIEGVACDGLIVEHNQIFNIADKNISIGEGSQNININHNLLVGATYGISVKDASTATIDHCTFDNNKYGVACFEKNTGLGGGIAEINNSIITNSTSNPLFLDETSTITTSYTMTNDELLFGENNMLDEPYYNNPFENNYHLSIYSPAIDAANPAYENDADGSRSDLGAFVIDKNANSNPIDGNIVLYPNPVTNNFILSLNNGNQSLTEISIFAINGQLVWQHDYLPNYSDIFTNDYFEINVSTLKSGYYLTEIKQEDRIEFVKFFVLD